MCFEGPFANKCGHHLWNIILNGGLLSLRISNADSTYSHLTFIVGSDKAAEAPHFSQFATDAMKLYRSSTISMSCKGPLMTVWLLIEWFVCGFWWPNLRNSLAKEGKSEPNKILQTCASRLNELISHFL